MITLFMDTSFRHLNLALYQDERILGSLHQAAFKSQSELILPELDKLFKAHQLQALDVDQIVLTDGPGSYTGLRIAMTIAKTLAALKDLKVYTLSSLHMMAGLANHTAVVMDARGGRVYAAQYHQATLQGREAILKLEDAQQLFRSWRVVGDGSLIGHEDVYFDVAEHVLALKKQWTLVADVEALVPRYLKEIHHDS